MYATCLRPFADGHACRPILKHRLLRQGDVSGVTACFWALLFSGVRPTVGQRSRRCADWRSAGRAAASLPPPIQAPRHATARCFPTLSPSRLSLHEVFALSPDTTHHCATAHPSLKLITSHNYFGISQWKLSPHVCFRSYWKYVFQVAIKCNIVFAIWLIIAIEHKHQGHGASETCVRDICRYVLIFLPCIKI